jgi:hypothetical protein
MKWGEAIIAGLLAGAIVAVIIELVYVFSLPEDAITEPIGEVPGASDLAGDVEAWLREEGY